VGTSWPPDSHGDRSAHWNRAATSRLVKVSYKTLLTKIAECELSLFADRGAGTTVNMRPAEIAFYRLAAIVNTAKRLG
jgi:hypothetical protein